MKTDTMIETQIKKTEVVPFSDTGEEDSTFNDTSFFESVIRNGGTLIDDHWLTYKRAKLKVVTC